MGVSIVTKNLEERHSKANPDKNTHRDGRYGKVLAGLARIDLLLINDWGFSPLDDQSRSDILEILEGRHDVRSTIVTVQLPISGWHEMMSDPPMTYAILDRLVQNAYKIELKGESMRKTLKSLTQFGYSSI